MVIFIDVYDMKVLVSFL